MDSPSSNPPPRVLPYGHTTSPKEGFRILGSIVGACFGIVAAIGVAICVPLLIESLVKTQSTGRIAYKVAGGCFLAATVACALTVVELRHKEIWFLRGFIVGAATLFLIIGLMFLSGR